MAKVLKKSTVTRLVVREVNGTVSSWVLLVGMQNRTATSENSLSFPQKLSRIAIWSSISTGMYIQN